MSFWSWLAKGFQPRTPAPVVPVMPMSQAIAEAHRTAASFSRLGNQLAVVGFTCQRCAVHGHSLHFEGRCLRCKEAFANDNGHPGGAR